MLKLRKKKSEVLAELLRKKLSEHPLSAGTPVASSREIAREYKVSLSTAEQCLQQLVDEGFLYRVRGSGTFLKQNGRGRTLRIGIADQIVSAQYLSPEVNRILNIHFEVAERTLIQQGCQVEMLSYQSLMTPHYPDHLNGLLISINYRDPDSMRLLREKQIPAVFYRHYHSEPEWSCVYYDYSTGIKEALNHLKIRRNERVHLVYETTTSGQYIHALWLEQLKLHGIREEQITSHEIRMEEREISCYRLIRVQAAKFKNSVILTGNDEIAANLINALTLEDFICGKDYRLVGCGDREAHGFMLGQKVPVIASIHEPIEAMAAEAAKLLLYKINSDVGYDCQIKIPTTFVPRLSAGCES